MVALLHAVFVALTLPSNAARKITDYVFFKIIGPRFIQFNSYVIARSALGT